ncbi:acyl-CoA thioesterase [Chloroflexota bacterium]
MTPADRFIAETSFRVRYAETDAMGIVHHASYIVYFEEGRSHYARVRGASYAALEQSGFALAVSEIHARYKVPARYDQVLTVCCWLEDMKSRSLTFGYEIINAETQTVLVVGQTKHICITHDGNVAKLPVDWRALLSGQAETQE